MINNEIRDEVRQRAIRAASEKELGGIIYETLAANQLDWHAVGNDNVKQLLVDAVRAYRHGAETTPFRVAV